MWTQLSVKIPCANPVTCCAGPNLLKCRPVATVHINGIFSYKCHVNAQKF